MKRVATVMAVVLLALTLTACSSSGGSSYGEIDIDKLAEDLLETVTSDSLSQTADSLIPSIYLLDEDAIESAIAYSSSGATACEITVIECSESVEASDVEEKLQDHVDSQKTLYASYNESEADRLKTAIIKSSGYYTVLCVCDDTDRAEEILKEYGF